MSNNFHIGIPESDLPVKQPSGAARVRYVEDGKSYSAAMPDVIAASALVQDAIDGIVAEAESQIGVIVNDMGYLPPVAFTSGLNVDSSRFTVTYGGVTYAPVADAVPFTTTGTFNPAQWRVIQGVTASDLASADDGKGAALVRYKPDETVKDRLDALGYLRGDLAGIGAGLGSDLVRHTLTESVRDTLNRHDGKIGAFITATEKGAVPDGVTDCTAALQQVIDLALASGGGTVYFPTGTYKISGFLRMRDGVRLLGSGGAKIKQADGANLEVMLEWGDYGYFPSDVTIENMIIDGNRANNTDSDNVFLLHIRGGTRATIKSCKVINSPGSHYASNGAHMRIVDNLFDNAYSSAGILLHNPTPVASHPYIVGNTVTNVGSGSFMVGFADYATVAFNTVIGTVIGGRGQRMTVDTNGTTVLHASGPDFANVRPGMFLVVGGGKEFRVTQKISNVELRIGHAAPTLVGAQASIGTGDLMGSFASSYGRFIGNMLIGGVTYSMGLSMGDSAYQCSHNIYANNTMYLSGKNAISVHYDLGAGFLEGNSFIGNKIYLPCNSGGIASMDRHAILVQSAAPGKVLGTTFTGNSVFSLPGDGQTLHWLAFTTNLPAGSVKISGNSVNGVANSGVYGDIISVALSPGWGTGATYDPIVSNGNSLRIRITCGTSTSAYPDVAINKVIDSGGGSPSAFIISKVITSTSGNIPTFGEQGSTQGKWTFTLVGTPMASAVYVVQLADVTG